MNRDLFPTQYDPEYVASYKLYWSRANMPSADRLGNGIGEWNKTRHIRPENHILTRCIVLYLDVIEATKRVRNNGRDVSVEYVIKPHFRKWLKDRTWEEFQERATAAQTLATETPPQPTRPSFKASDLLWPPPGQEPKRSAREILAAHRAKIPLDTR